MPQSLWDMFQPQDYGGKPIGFDQALRQNSNSLIGLGMGMLQPHSLAVGAPVGNSWTSGLEGYQQGATQDLRRNVAQAQLQHQKTQEARQAAMDAFHRSQAGQQQANWERQFERSDPAKALTDAQRAYRDIYGIPGAPDYKGTPETQQEFFKQFYLPKTEGDWIAQTDTNTGTPYQLNKRTGETRAVQVPGGTAPANPYAPAGKMTTDEGKTALFADRAATAHDAITKAENINAEPGGTIGGLIQQTLPPGAANVLVSGERGKSMDAQRAFINALLRRESGAAINAGEFTSYAKEYFPQLGDTPDQIESKRKHRAEVIAGLARESGKGYRPTYSFDEKGNIRLGAPSYAGSGGAAPAPRAAGAIRRYNPETGKIE